MLDERCLGRWGQAHIRRLGKDANAHSEFRGSGRHHPETECGAGRKATGSSVQVVGLLGRVARGDRMK